MRPSRTHEYVKTTIGRLLEAYAPLARIRFTGLGSLTIRNAPKERGAEPDESYCIGPETEHPNLVIEVVLTTPGVDKRTLYAGLGVRELREWRDGRFAVLTLRDGGFVPLARSELRPDLDLGVLARLVMAEDQSAAVDEVMQVGRDHAGDRKP
jgi:Uma2 family endonuclease